MAKKNYLEYDSGNLTAPKQTQGGQAALVQAAGAMQQPTDWEGQVQNLTDRINNRPGFAYNPDTDPLWQGIKDQYVRGGQRAMEDTMGQAAGLTGGYANSYAQSVGQQQYNDFMTKLAAELPTAYDRARAAYDAEGDELWRRLNLAQGMADREYQHGRDALNDERYQDELAYGRQRDTIADQRYQDELDWDRDWQRQQWDYKTQQQEQDDARSYAQYLLQMGILPNADQLAAAGISPEEARHIQAYYNQQMAGTGGGGGSTGGGGYRYTGNGDKGNGDKGNGDKGNGDAAGTTYNPVQAALDTIRNGTGGAWDLLGLPRNQQNQGAQGTGGPRPRSYQDLYNMVTNDVDVRNAGQNIAMQDEIHYAAEQGTITEAQARKLIGMIGLKK